MKNILYFVAIWLITAGAAMAQPACTSGAPGVPACQAQAVSPQQSDIVFGQQATGPSRTNQTVKFSLSQLAPPPATTSVFGTIKCDGVTITCTAGVISAISGGAGNIVGSGATTVGHPGCFNNTSATALIDCVFPAVNLTTATATNLSGLVKGNGSTLVVALAGTDYLAPSGNGSALTGLLWSQIGSTPTTRAGYGIADAAKNGANSDITSLSGLTTPLSPAQGGTGVNNGSNTFTTSLPFAITGSGAQTFFFGNSGIPWTYSFPQATATLDYQVGAYVNGHCLQASGTAGGIADSGAACGTGSMVYPGAGIPVSTGSAWGASYTLGSTIVATSNVLNTTVPNSTKVANYTIAAGDMGGQLNFNTPSLTATIPAISSTVFAAGMSLTINNLNASALTISSTPTINGFNGTSIPQYGGINCVSNGTSLDCVGLGVLANEAFLNVAQTWAATQTFGSVIAGVNTQSGTTYTLAAADCGKTVVATNASPITVTTFQAAVVGCNIVVEQGGAGQITFANGGSATLVSAHSYTKTFNAKGATVNLFCDVNAGAAAEWILSGDGA